MATTDDNLLDRYFSQWKDRVDEAYALAQAGISNEAEGKLVELHFPLEVDGGKARIPKILGVPENIKIEKIPERQRDFAVHLEMESGRRFLDPEAIVVLENDGNEKDRGWRRADSELPSKKSPDSHISNKVEVSLFSGERKFDRYNFETSTWQKSGQKVKFWKRMEAGPEEP